MTDKIAKSTIALALATMVVSKLGLKYLDRQELKANKKQLSEKLAEHPDFVKEIQAAKTTEQLVEVGESILPRLEERAQVKKGVIMKEDLKQREMRLKKELAKVRSQNAADNRKATVSRDYSIGGLPPDTTHKPINASNDVPDVVLLPSKKRGKKENIPF
tara:strand:+ start:172 stop:651 length:480 start_codon:yes stop_codon:yes gene_type:complete